MNTLFDIADGMFVRLAWATAQATVLIGALWLLGRAAPRLSPAIRCMLWWLVAAQLVLGITVGAPIQLHLLPAQHVTTVATHIAVPAGGAAAAPTVVLPVANEQGLVAAWSWQRGFVALWLLGVLLQLLSAVRQWRASRTLVRASQPLLDTALQSLCAGQAHAQGLRHIPHLRLSDAIASPQVTGWWRPLVLLPARQSLSPEETSMALAHELAHLQRGDLWLGWVPAIAQRLFFFHPLVAWAMREYAIYREAACDAQVLQRQHAAPQSYGHLLLRLGVAHPLHAGLAGASSTFQNLKRRLTLLQQNDAMPRPHGWALVVLIALVGILPYRVTATSTVQDIADVAPPAAPAPPAPLPAPPSPTAAVPAVPAPPPAPPAPPAAPVHAFGFASHVDIDTTAQASRGIALFDGDTVIINGSDADEAAAQAQHRDGHPLLWFRRGDKAYVVHDAALIAQAKRAYIPISKMAQAQGELAGKQGQLAGEQGGIAARQGALADREAAIADRRAQLDAEHATTQTATDAAHAAGVAGQLAGISAEEAEISRENRELDGEAARISQQAEALSKQQADLSAQQAAVTRRAEQELDKVLDQAVTKGLAESAIR